VTTEVADRDAAARGEQRLLVVVGEPHPQHAVQMARQQSPRDGNEGEGHDQAHRNRC